VQQQEQPDERDRDEHREAREHDEADRGAARYADRLEPEHEPGVERARVARRRRDGGEQRGEHDDLQRVEDVQLEAERVADQQQRQALAAPGQHGQAGEQETLDVREQPQRAHERPDLRVERVEEAAPAQRQVADEPDRGEHERDRGHGGGRLPGRRARDVRPRQHHEQRSQHRGVQQALGDDRGEDLPPPRGRAAAEQPDAQDLAAAHRQHVVAHVADQRQPVGVRALVRDAGQAQDAVPAEAADRERHAVDADGADEPRPAARRVRELRRVLLGDPPRHRRQRDDRHEEAEAPLGLRADVRHVSGVRGGGAAGG